MGGGRSDDGWRGEWVEGRREEKMVASGRGQQGSTPAESPPISPHLKGSAQRGCFVDTPRKPWREIMRGGPGPQGTELGLKVKGDNLSVPPGDQGLNRLPGL